MPNSIERIIANLRSDSPSDSIWADLDGLVIEIQPAAVIGITCNINNGNKRTYHYDKIDLANYLEQNYV